MRRDHLKINRAEGLREIKEDLRQALKDHHTLLSEKMEKAADYIYSGAFERVPVKTGRLQDGIQVDVSYSPRYPGIIATATAQNVKTGYDYALIQEVNEGYKHDNGGQAHYLEEPFREAVEQFYEEMGWK